MPGGRLSPQDRRTIAVGLAGGSSFAEIARELSRPTSTISREVLRNGGSTGYDPDRAQQSTRDRAWRRGPVPAGDGRHAGPGSGDEPGNVAVVEAELTEALIGTGLPRMTARVLACLYTTDSGALTAADLVRRLGVSPASISKAVSELEQQGQLRREREPAGRRDRYVIDADVWYESWREAVRQLTVLAETLDRAAIALGPRTGAGTRLTEAGGIFRDLGAEMTGSAERLRRRRATPRRRPRR
ncbi:helix-turn-helix domain-containing protein [Microlunatus sp. GCM10028923]|uniref:GbsR/MarR family transcriptional regulator n=1 Tax=Microlunatus sp. GCM10028923 TaxID=3273400 RepID=UPI00361BE86F